LHIFGLWRTHFTALNFPLFNLIERLHYNSCDR
jgi:hypothetical protein